MARGQAIRFEEHLAQRLRETREQAGLRQSEVARAMRGVGLAWTQATVSAVETGRRDLATIELAAVCGVLGAGVTDLIGRRGDVRVGNDVRRVKVSQVGDALAFGRPLPPTLDARLDEDDEACRKAARALSEHYGRSVAPGEVDEAARVLWGVALSVERDSRLEEALDPETTPRQRQARRGHMTRRLLDELRSEWFDLDPGQRPTPDPDPFPDAVDASGVQGGRRAR